MNYELLYNKLVWAIKTYDVNIKNQLIGQSPEDLERHYKLIGKRDVCRTLLEAIEEYEKEDEK